LLFHERNIIKNEIIPYRTEWSIYDEDTKLAGTLDMAYLLNQNDDKNIILYDWKKVKKLDIENKYEKAYAPISHLPNCNWAHYSL